MRRRGGGRGRRRGGELERDVIKRAPLHLSALRQPPTSACNMQSPPHYFCRQCEESPFCLEQITQAVGEEQVPVSSARHPIFALHSGPQTAPL